MRVLTCVIVDDEPLAVKLLESYVGKTDGLELVASFTDSVEAISMIKSHPVDLLFLDIQMPDMNGMELAHMIPAETRVVFTTAFTISFWLLWIKPGNGSPFRHYHQNIVYYLLNQILRHPKPSSCVSMENTVRFLFPRFSMSVV